MSCFVVSLISYKGRYIPPCLPISPCLPFFSQCIVITLIHYQKIKWFSFFDPLFEDESLFFFSNVRVRALIYCSKCARYLRPTWMLTILSPLVDLIQIIQEKILKVFVLVYLLSFSYHKTLYSRCVRYLKPIWTLLTFSPLDGLIQIIQEKILKVFLLVYFLSFCNHKTLIIYCLLIISEKQ